MSIILDQIRETIAQYELINKGDSVVVGFSGGPDSVCLLHSLYTLREELGIDKLAAVHINHMYRGEAAYADEEFCREFCSERDILFYSYQYDVNSMAVELKMSSEEVGRLVRYKEFRAIAEELGGGKIAVAHNREDQAETLIMRLSRGTGTEGLCGIDYFREGGIVRPLLNCSRRDIEAYCEENDLRPRIDHTNLEPIYTRNVVRLEIIPYINEKMGCSIVDSLAVLSDIAKEDRDFIGGFVEDIVKDLELENRFRGSLSREVLKGLHPAVRKRVIVKCFAALDLETDIGAVHLAAAEKLLLSEKTTGQTEFPHKYLLKCRYDKVIFEKVHESDTTEEYGIECRTIFEESEIKLICRDLPDRRSRVVQYFDADRIGDAKLLKVRTRQAGDTISPKGFSGTKKLKDYFIDRKIDRDLRGKLPLVCVGSQVLWIPGFEVSQKFLPDDDSKALLEVRLVNEA